MKHTSIFCKLICAMLCAAMILPLAACGETKLTQREVYAMDTVMTLSAYGNKADNGLSAAESIILSMDKALDPELSTSKVYEINHAQGSSVVISSQIAGMISTAYDVYTKSEVDSGFVPVATYNALAARVTALENLLKLV